MAEYDRLGQIESSVAAIQDAVTAFGKKPQRPGAAAAPAVLTEGVRGDRPFSMYNFLMKGLPSGNYESCQMEREVCKQFKEALIRSNSMITESTNGLWLPTNLSGFGGALDNPSVDKEMRFVKSAMASAMSQETDPDEIQWMENRGYIRKAVSAYQDNLGGTLVAPPTMGPVNELIRPEAAALAAGATSIPLPPSGRYVEPRITGAPGVNAVGEGQLAVISDLTTDQIEMVAKKFVGAVSITDEATLFTSGSLDNYARSELNRSLGLKIDAYAFYGTGGDKIPSGITSAQYINQIIAFHNLTGPVPRGVQTNGNVLLPEYGDIFEGLVADRSFGLDGNEGAWVMRPITFAAAAAYRADSVTAGDRAGPKVDILRRFNEAMPTMWGQRKVIRSTNILGTGTKGTGTGLGDVFYAIWKYMLIGTYGAVNFREGVVNDNLLRGLKTVTATMYGDIALRHPGAFGYYTQVLGANGML